MAAWPLMLNGFHINIEGINTNATRNPLLVEARKLKRAFEKETGDSGFMKEANRQSLLIIQKRAQENLISKMSEHGRPPIRNTQPGGRPSLQNEIVKMKYSYYSGASFAFLQRAKIFPVVPYYASIEYGDDSQVGRYIYFNFLGTNPRTEKRRSTNPGTPNRADNFNPGAYRHRHYANVARSQALRSPKHQTARKAMDYSGATYSDRIIGPRERGWVRGSNEGWKGNGSVRVKIKRPVPAYRYGRDAVNTFIRQKEYGLATRRASEAFRKKHRLELVFR